MKIRDVITRLCAKKCIRVPDISITHADDNQHKNSMGLLCVHIHTHIYIYVMCTCDVVHIHVMYPIIKLINQNQIIRNKIYIIIHTLYSIININNINI